MPVPLELLELRPPRIEVPGALREISSQDIHERAVHALGKSYLDIVRGFRGQFEHPPDLVVRPRNEEDLERVLEWCTACSVAAIPFGGGTSVVGGVTPDVGSGYNGVVSIDMAALDRLLEVDQVSLSACIEAGATGPGLEAQLAEHDLTLRHFPQSFEYSTLGGWIATRAAGHFASIWTHIEDFLESARAITPTGEWSLAASPARAPGRAPTGCSSAQRARSVSSRAPGSGCSAGPPTGLPRACASRALWTVRSASAQSPRQVSIRPTAGCSIPARPA